MTSQIPLSGEMVKKLQGVKAVHKSHLLAKPTMKACKQFDVAYGEGTGVALCRLNRIMVPPEVEEHEDEDDEVSLDVDCPQLFLLILHLTAAGRAGRAGRRG